MKKQLLVVDDEPAIQLILTHYFSAEYSVVTRANGALALQWLNAGHAVDAIVADYQMPVMDGPAFIEQVRRHPLHRHVPVLVLSGLEETSSKIRCLRHGADDYLVKPFSPEELGLRLQAMLRRQPRT
ncbi:response regulator transcription factor [Hymenobacter rigui]|uniref:Response regulator n=1 Tax=Hymenobacter rigui TaxID=334424 RepID=A0A428K9G6_9BACT|nr:response regulator [Hymenobacter rigui]RSK43081.1 response regulator [Hymenobacter rigui]